MWVQAIKQQIEEGNMNFSTLRVLSDAAIVAVQRPAKYFIPIVAISNILRTATMALQIAAESDLLVRLHWIARTPAISASCPCGCLSLRALQQ